MCYAVAVTWIAILVKPFFALAFLTSLAFVRWLVIRYMPNSKFKRLLLLNV